MGAASKVLGLPSFLFSVFVLYWSLPIFAVLYRIRFAKMIGKRNDVLDWAKSLVRFFGITVLRQGQEQLYTGGPCLYLCNHRSWADFFLDVYLTEGHAAVMSRWLVYFVFPVFCTSCLILKTIVLFKRGTIRDKEGFNRWLDAVLARSNVPGLLVFPEGHRSLRPASLPLKRGMLHYAYGRKLAIQMVVTRGKEEVMSEKTMAVRFGRTLVTTYSKVLRPADYPDFEAFFADLQSTWDGCWEAAYRKPREDAVRHSLGAAPGFHYPFATRVAQLGATLGSIALFGLVLVGCWRGLAAALAATGAAQQAVAALLAVWVGGSMLRSFL